MSYKISSLLRSILPELIRGEEIEPTAKALDQVWKHIAQEDEDFASNVCLETDGIDEDLINFVKTGDLEYALNLRQKCLHALRSEALQVIMPFESSIKNAALHE